MKEKNPQQPAESECGACDKSPVFCRADNNPSAETAALPRDARLPINRCNLPAVILGSPTYQQHPTPLVIDGVAELHAALFRRLDTIADPGNRADYFRDYLTVHFRLETPEDAGFTAQSDKRGKARAKATWRRMLRGWSFDADSREGAVLKGWVQSRFGLTPRFHGEALRDPSAPAYRRYLEMQSSGLYGTNALEAQFDLVYAYCQYELARQWPGQTHLTLYRGINRVGEHEVLGRGESEAAGQRGPLIMLLNNLNSFTCQRERASEFGDFIMTVEVPLTKLFFYCGLLPGVLQGEDEFLVIGGVYATRCSTL